MYKFRKITLDNVYNMCVFLKSNKIPIVMKKSTTKNYLLFEFAGALASAFNKLFFNDNKDFQRLKNFIAS